MAYEETSVTTDVVSLTFKPNADVAGFAACLFEKGQAESQYNMFGAWMGFTCMGDMIKSWGFQGNVNDTTFTWTGQTPNTEYEVYVQCWDVNGTYADMIIIPIVTKKLGGEGTAEVAIEVKESKYYEGYDAFTQRVIFTPNENVSVYHASLFDYSFYEENGKDGITSYLQADVTGDPYWNLYKTDDYEWELEPSSKYVAAAIAKNANDEWGPLTLIEFETPATADEIVPANSSPAYAKSKAAASKGVPVRMVQSVPALRGVSPYASSKSLKKGLQLTGK